jgi:Uma2 family endonuclease
MATATLTRGLEMSEDEYLESLANSKRFEFCNGVVTAKRGPYMTKKRHVIIAEELAFALRSFRTQAGGFSGQTPTTNLSEGVDRLYRMPDVAYWAAGRPVGDGIFQPPTLAIEIVSADQSVPALREKCGAYRAHGVSVCWLIDPEERWVEAWDAARSAVRLPDAGVLEAPELPGFSLPLATLWSAIDNAPD